MKLPISTLTWLVATSVIYFVIAMLNLFVFKVTETEYIEMVWLLITSIPLWLPMSKFINIDPIWKL